MMGNSVLFVFQNSKRGKILNSYLLEGLHSPVGGKNQSYRTILEVWGDVELASRQYTLSKKDAIFNYKKSEFSPIWVWRIDDRDYFFFLAPFIFLLSVTLASERFLLYQL